MIDPVYRFQLSARSVLGQIRLRRSLPNYAPVDRPNAQELAFYKKVLQMASRQSHRIDAVVDVGCRNWSYARALRESFPYARSFVGIEIDAYRRYWNGFRRIDYAESAARYLKATGAHAAVIPKSYFDVTQDDLSRALPADTKNILWLFLLPFVSQAPCKAWGISSENSNFTAFLSHTEILSSGYEETNIFSCHQGEWEASSALAAYNEVRINDLSRGAIGGHEIKSIWPNTFDHFVFSGIFKKNKGITASPNAINNTNTI